MGFPGQSRPSRYTQNPPQVQGGFRRAKLVHIGPMRLLLTLSLLFALPSLAEASEKKVARLWKARCSACHGLDGRGQTETGRKLKLPDFTQPAWQAKTTDDFIRNRVTNGLKEEREGVLTEMPAFKDELAPEHLDALVALVRKLATAPAP